jgi:hypothetical protein
MWEKNGIIGANDTAGCFEHRKESSEAMKSETLFD